MLLPILLEKKGADRLGVVEVLIAHCGFTAGFTGYRDSGLPPVGTPVYGGVLNIFAFLMLLLFFLFFFRRKRKAGESRRKDQEKKSAAPRPKMG